MQQPLPPGSSPAPSAEALFVTYRVRADAAGIDGRVRDICVEQTVEVTEPLFRDAFFQDEVLGRVESLQEIAPGDWEAVIRFPADVIAGEVTQLWSVVFGNISLKPGVRVTAVRPTPGLARRLGGPGLGIPGLRAMLGVASRPLLLSALKPMGRSTAELAGYAYALARGGMDILKDDHGITDQRWAPYRERVAACCDAVRRANEETGGRCRYFPTVTAPADQVLDRARFARDHGAGGLLFSPLVGGPDFLRVLGRETGLPVMAHPAMTGAFLGAPDHGVAHDVILGSLMRLSGADLVVFPGFGGRFPFSKDQCRALDRALKDDLSDVLPSLPTPAGGLTLERVPETLAVFGPDVGFLIGSALYERSPDLESNARWFREMVDSRH